MTGSHEVRLRALELAAKPHAGAADIQPFLRDPCSAPTHARPILDHLRRFAAASMADSCANLDETLARLREEKFEIDAAMIEAAVARLG